MTWIQFASIFRATLVIDTKFLPSPQGIHSEEEGKVNSEGKLRLFGKAGTSAGIAFWALAWLNYSIFGFEFTTFHPQLPISLKVIP